MAQKDRTREEEALKRAQAPKRPAGLGNDDIKIEETIEDEVAFRRPERVEHTSEKEHPPGKE